MTTPTAAAATADAASGQSLMPSPSIQPPMAPSQPGRLVSEQLFQDMEQNTKALKQVRLERDALLLGKQRSDEEAEDLRFILQLRKDKLLHIQRCADHELSYGQLRRAFLAKEIRGYQTAEGTAIYLWATSVARYRAREDLSPLPAAVWSAREPTRDELDREAEAAAARKRKRKAIEH